MPIDPYEDLHFADGPSQSEIWYFGRLSKRAFAKACNEVVFDDEKYTADDVDYQWWDVCCHAQRPCPCYAAKDVDTGKYIIVGSKRKVFVTCLKKGR